MLDKARPGSHFCLCVFVAFLFGALLSLLDRRAFVMARKCRRTREFIVMCIVYRFEAGQFVAANSSPPIGWFRFVAKSGIIRRRIIRRNFRQQISNAEYITI